MKKQRIEPAFLRSGLHFVVAISLLKIPEAVKDGDLWALLSNVVVALMAFFEIVGRRAIIARAYDAGFKHGLLKGVKIDENRARLKPGVFDTARLKK